MLCQPFFQIFNDLLMIQIVVGLMIASGVHQKLLVGIAYFFKKILTSGDCIDRVSIGSEGVSPIKPFRHFLY